MQLPLIAILGPTASGKTTRAVSLALTLDAEIVSADSRQVYKGMDLGTGKDIEEYAPLFEKYESQISGTNPGVHLIDICGAGSKYNLHQYLADYYKAEHLIRSRNHNLILCGGTGMYAEAVLSGIRLPEVPEDRHFREAMRETPLEELHRILAEKKELHNTTDVDTHARAVRALEIARYYEMHPQAARLADKSLAKRPDSIIFLIDIPREKRRERITRRMLARLEAGMDTEVRKLLQSGVSADDLIYYGLEYKYVTLYVTGRITLNEMMTRLETAIHQFAKRQMTWFRGMERRGFRLHPLPYDLPADSFLAQAQSIIEAHSRPSTTH